MALTGAQKQAAFYGRKKAENRRLVRAFLTPEQIEYLDSMGLKSRTRAIEVLVEASAGSASSSKFTLGSRPSHPREKRVEPA